MHARRERTVTADVQCDAAAPRGTWHGRDDRCGLSE